MAAAAGPPLPPGANAWMTSGIATDLKEFPQPPFGLSVTYPGGASITKPGVELTVADTKAEPVCFAAAHFALKETRAVAYICHV